MLWLLMNWCLMSLPMLIVLQKETIWFYNCSNSNIRHSQNKKKLSLSGSQRKTTPFSLQVFWWETWLNNTKLQVFYQCMYKQSDCITSRQDEDGSLQEWFFILFRIAQGHEHYRLLQTKTSKQASSIIFNHWLPPSSCLGKSESDLRLVFMAKSIV